MARRHDAGARRLAVVVTLVASLLLTLLGRLYYVQLLDPHKPAQLADLQRSASIVVPAPRGDILDALGRPLVDDTAVQVITVDRQTVLAQADHGTGVLVRLAGLLRLDPVTLAEEIRPCSPTVSAPCWTGEPYQPVPVSTDASAQVVLAISEHRELYPGVSVQSTTQPNYPGGDLAAHVLGYTGDVTAADIQSDPGLHDADTIGLSGLEQQYDAVLRGVDGSQSVQLDPQGDVVGQGGGVAPVQGDTLVTSIDARVQQLVQQALVQQIQATRAAGKPATSGSVVVMDPNTGRIVAIASWPTYDPQEFVGGISDAAYAKLIAPSAHDPLLDRAVAGQYAPGSTFKLITASSDVTHGEVTLDGTYPCPSSLTIDGRVKTNYDSETLGPIDLENALGYSCDTFFYAPAAAEYYADQTRIAAGKKPHEFLQKMAASYGVGTAPGIDLPADEQATGSYADRETRIADWKANKATYCAEARSGYRDVSNPSTRAYLTLLASQNCTDGWRYRAGDNADLAIGQGETTVSPLQLAVAYSALVNGGRIWEPTLGWGIVDGAGKVVRTINPKVRNTVPVSQNVLNYIADSLAFSRGWAVSGAFAYIGSPIQHELGGKTGTAEVYGKADTSWLASWGPTKTLHGAVNANFVVVGMIEQGGTGATAAGPMLKKIWNGLLGVGARAVIPGSRAEASLPAVAPQIQVTAAAAHAPLSGPVRTPPTGSAPDPGPGPSRPSGAGGPSRTPDVIPAPSPRIGSRR